MHTNFGLMLFSTNGSFVCEAVRAGVDAIVVDWEHVGKHRRQPLADTQINHDTVDDLRRIRACTQARVICRVNNCPSVTARELELAIEAGADELLLPMVRTVAEVEAALRQVAGRCGVGILIETVAALGLAPELGRLRLSRVYVGMNDLAIERGTANIFMALVDGTVEHVRRWFRVPFGFGGLTVPELGVPIPCRLLIGEMARLACDFGVLRRSFHRDVRGRDLAIETPRIREALGRARMRSPEEVARDRHDLEVAVRAWAPPVHEHLGVVCG